MTSRCSSPSRASRRQTSDRRRANASRDNLLLKLLVLVVTLVASTPTTSSATATYNYDRAIKNVQSARTTISRASVRVPAPAPTKAARSSARPHIADFLAAKGAGEAERGGLNLFKWKHPSSTTAEGWREGDRVLAVPWKGTPKATWRENASRLRREMRSGEPIYETYVDSAGNLIPTKGFLNAERSLLRNRGWQYDPRTRAWTPGR